MLVPKEGLTFYYRRDNSPGLHVRDLFGGHHVLTQRAGRWMAQAVSTAPPWYNRVDWQNHGRFTRGLHPDLTALFEDAGPGCILDSPEVHLPTCRQNSARVSQQGMREAMEELFKPKPAPASATQYAARIGVEGQHEWCHLIAHSMGGGNGPSNVVAGASYNNSEQLIIENLLCSYLTENLFSVQVSARLHDADDGRYLGLAIRYVITDGVEAREVFLDCQAANQPTEVHLVSMNLYIARWLNRRLKKNSTRNVTPQQLQEVLEDCPQFAQETGKRRRPDDDLGDRSEHLPNKRARPGW